jgi:nucleotide-binding universal stress UspA family protein
LRVLASPQAGTAVNAFDWILDKAEAEAYLEGTAVRLQTAGVATKTLVMAGQPATVVTDFVQNQKVDLVIVSSHGESGTTGSNLGSSAQNILLRSQVSSLLVRADQPAPVQQTDLRYRHLLVPLDGSQRATHVLPFATTLARLYDSRLLLVHVLSQPEMPRHGPLSPEHQALGDQLTAHNHEAMTQHFARLASQLPAATESRLLEREDVAASLHEIAEAEGIDLVILSAHGYSGGNQWPYGSITANLIAYGRAPLLLIQDLPADWTPAAAGAARKDSDLLELTSGRLPSARPYDWTPSS